jgi:predicted enzyme related to lactoylglutathione lyase
MSGSRPQLKGSHWLIYFHASDCEALTDKAKSLGGKVCCGPMTMENVGRLSILADPQGAYFAVFQPMRKGQVLK